MTTSHTLTDLVREERQAFVDTLETLTPEQWGAQSLCSEWRVIDVAAHVAWAPVWGPAAGATAWVRNGFSLNRTIARSAVGWSDRGRAAILDQLRRNVVSGAKPHGMPTATSLVDAVVHGIDVRRPLGLTRAIPADVLAPVADFALRATWPLTGVVGGSARRRVHGVRLVASDVDWSHGDGPEVHAPAEAIVLLLHGRAPDPDELTGDGAAALRARG